MNHFTVQVVHTSALYGSSKGSLRIIRQIGHCSWSEMAGLFTVAIGVSWVGEWYGGTIIYAVICIAAGTGDCGATSGMWICFVHSSSFFEWQIYGCTTWCMYACIHFYYTIHSSSECAIHWKIMVELLYASRCSWACRYLSITCLHGYEGWMPVTSSLMSILNIERANWEHW